MVHSSRGWGTCGWIPSQAGVDLNLRILDNFAKHVAPALGWKPNTEGPVKGDAIG